MTAPTRHSFQDLILKLSSFWAGQGCVLQQPYDLEVGAGTMHPDTFLRVLGPEPWRVAYVQPSRRPADGRYGDNPFRLGKHYQFQVILKPEPPDIQNLYVRSLEAMGLDLSQHDLRFEEDNWEAPTLGAWGVGWQVMLDGMEITQFTYFQQAGGLDLSPISAEITYGLERLTMFLGLTRSVYDIDFVPGGVSYGQVRHQDEVESSKYYFELADVDFLKAQFDGWEREAGRCLEAGLVLPAYECTLKCSHLFNVLDARGAISVTGRVAAIKRVRDLAVAAAKAYADSRERLEWPLLKSRPAPAESLASEGQREPATVSSLSTPSTGPGAGEYLLEVRAEEIPARMLEPAIKELATKLFEELVARSLAPREVETGSTPRRLLVVLKGLPAREPDTEEQIVGPPVKAAYNAEGQPTQALLGFAKRCGVAPEQLERVATEKGEYLAAREKRVGRPTREVLAELVPKVLKNLSWAKTMVWGSGYGPWARPLHGLLSLLDGEVVPFELFGVVAGRESIGHPVLSPQPFGVADAADYRAKLAARGVEPSPEERRKRLLEAMYAAAARRGGALVEDAALAGKLAAICEIPGLIEGSFDESFLELPREVLITSLRDHQSAFTVEKDGMLLPVFLTVMDRPDDPIGRVESGNEWVVAARLADARFFHHEDGKRSLVERAPALEQLNFHAQLGSYAAKAGRIEALAAWLCQELGAGHEAAAAREAARLMKVDLTTEMVKEFTSLQGVMGGLYARAQGHAESVWQAIYDQYLPASMEDTIPRGLVGRVLGLADRLDTLVGMFGLGFIPSGSRDPFGLRRAAQGVVRICLDGGWPLDLAAVLTEATRLYGDGLKKKPEEIAAPLLTFLDDRIRFVLGARGYSYDEIEAGLAAGRANLPDLARRVEALHGVRESKDFLSLVLSAKRIANILKEAPSRTLDPGGLVEPAEQNLYQALGSLEVEVEAAAAAGDYARVYERTAALAPVLDQFFVEVMVMVDDERLKNNRLALLQAINQVANRAARLTEVVVDRAEHRAKHGT